MKYTLPEALVEAPTNLVKGQHQHHVAPVKAPLYVVTCITNPERYYSRYKLYHAFAKMVEDSGAILYTIECAFRNREHEVTDACNPRHIQLRSTEEIWLKENLLNIAVSRLPADWEYVAWIDADVVFARPDWVAETIHQLQHYHMVQMWSHAQDLGPEYDLGPDQILAGPHQSFMYSYVNGVTLPKYLAEERRKCDVCSCKPCSCRPCPTPDPGSSGSYGGGRNWHSGYAWAARRSAFSDLGGLGDISILGSADHHMAAALFGKVENTIHQSMHPEYLAYWLRWQENAERYIRRNVGYVPGLLLHNWHGSKKSRKYSDRWKILTEEQYNPVVDIKRDPQSIIQLTDRNTRLRDRIRQYFRERNEDSLL